MPYNYLINWNDQLKKAHKNKIYMFVSENMFSFFGRERGGGEGGSIRQLT